MTGKRDLYDELLESDPAARRRAAAALGDRHDADDLVQDLWLALMHRRQEIRSARGWWAGAIRRQAFRRRTASAARRERELQTETPNHAEATDELAVQAELRSIALDELARLPGPERDALTGHYLEGRSLPEIARAEKLSHETIRTRHRRGMARLRSRIDRHLRTPSPAGQRGAWVAPLLAAEVAIGKALEIGARSAGILGVIGALATWTWWRRRQPKQERTLMLRWTALSALGFAIGIPLGVAASGPLEMAVAMMLVAPLMFSITGGVLGGAQWCALRRIGWSWVPWSSFGLSIGLTAGTVAVEWVGSVLTGAPVRASTAPPWQLAAAVIAIGSAGGACLGLAQWWAARRTDWVLALSWVLWNTASFAAAFALGLAGAEWLTAGLASPAGIATFLSTAGAFIGLATSLAVVQLRRGGADAATPAA